MSSFANSTNSKEIARDIFLIRKETATTISYEIDNAKYKRILFKMDFRGSENLHLLTGGLQIRTTVQPYARVQVAVLRVTDTRRSSRLSVKYTWEEEEPSQPPSTVPKREELAPDIFVYTTRYHDPTSFHFAVFCGKYRRLRFTASFVGSSNLALEDGTQRRTVIVEPYQKVNLGRLGVIDSSRGWTYKAKFSWEEDEVDVQTTPSTQLPVPATAPASAPETSRQEIARGVNLITSRESLPGGHTQIILYIDCIKYKNVRCQLDFGGSQNLRIISGSDIIGLSCTAVVSAYQKREVARLRTRYPDRSWKLKQNITFTEEEPASVAREVVPPLTYARRRGSFNNVYRRHADGSWRSGSQVPATPYPAQLAVAAGEQKSLSSIPPPPPSEQASEQPAPPPPGIVTSQVLPVRELLQQLSLSVYLPLFQAEALDDLELLKSLASRGELRSTLSELGVSKLGHREKILRAVIEAQ